MELKKLDDAKIIAKHAHIVFSENTDILLILIQIYQIESNYVQVNNLLIEGHKKFPKNEQIAILYAFYNKNDSKKILENFSDEGDVIYDPFLGTGTTAVVCKMMNRRYIGSELSKDYFKIITKMLKEAQVPRATD